MRFTVLSLVLCSLALVACSTPEATRTTRKPTPGQRERGQTSTDDLTESELEDDPILEDPDPSPLGPVDSDGDGVIDEEDCEPSSPSVGMRLLQDPLATDKGFFASADGFPATSWTYDGAYRQARIADAADTSLFVGQPSVEDVLVEIRSASTEISNAYTPTLRQIFVLLGATVTGGQLGALGCGVEVDSTQSPQQKTSVVRLAGPPANVATTLLDQGTRPALQVNQEFRIEARLSKGTLTCRVTQDVDGVATTTTATASGLGAVKGAVGLFTRQSKALFKQARICELN